MNKFREVVWTDEKSFVLQLHQYRRNDCILVPIVAHDPNLRLVKRRKQPCSVMVFGAVGSDGSVMDPIIIPNTTTINSASYQNLVLPKLLDWMRATYGPMTGFRGKLGTGRAVLMQDGAPPHTSNSTQKYLEDHIGKDNFWKKTQWPPSSPDANPMDFSLLASLAAATTGSRLAASTGSAVPKNRTELVRKLEGTWHETLMPDYLKRCCSSAWDRLRRIVAAEGGYKERIRTAAMANEDDTDENNNVGT